MSSPVNNNTFPDNATVLEIIRIMEEDGYNMDEPPSLESLSETEDYNSDSSIDYDELDQLGNVILPINEERLSELIINCQSKTNCGVCLDKESNIKLRDCLHSFHQACIEKWLRIKPCCPICNFDYRDFLRKI